MRVPDGMMRADCKGSDDQEVCDQIQNSADGKDPSWQAVGLLVGFYKVVYWLN